MKYLKAKIFSLTFLFLSCTNTETENLPNLSEDSELEWCTEINAQDFPILATGFEPFEIDTVLIRTFKQNTNFTEFVNEFYCLPENIRMDSTRKSYTIFPAQELISSYDWQIVLSDSTVYNVDSIIVLGERVSTQTSNSGKICGINSYRINGSKKYSSNVTIEKYVNYLPIPNEATGLYCN